jgi:hypothetical protein
MREEPVELSGDAMAGQFCQRSETVTCHVRAAIPWSKLNTPIEITPGHRPTGSGIPTRRASGGLRRQDRHQRNGLSFGGELRPSSWDFAGRNASSIALSRSGVDRSMNLINAGIGGRIHIFNRELY